MKSSPISVLVLVSSAAALLAASASAAPISWTGATDANWTTGLGANWLGGGVPGPGDTAVFDANSTANLATVLGAPFSILGVQVTTPAGPVSIGGPDTLTLGSSGIDLSAATQNLSITAPLSLGANQSWNVAAGRLLTVSGGITRTTPRVLSVIGAGQIQLTGAISLDQMLVGNGVAAGEVIFGPGSAWTQAGSLTGLGLAVGNANGSGSVTFSGGTHILGGDGYSGAVGVGTTTGGGQAASGTLTISGATVQVGSAGATDASINVGVLKSGGTSAEGTLTVSAGTLEVGRRILLSANGSATTTTATLNLSGTGTIEMKRTGSSAEGDLGMLRVGAGTTTFNLDGGTLIASAIHTSAGAAARTIINYNGTTVRANVATTAFVTAAGNATHRVKAGGFIFDTNGFDVTYGGSLVNDTGVAGTVTKLGAGVLTLPSPNSTTGQVAVNGGALALIGNATFGAGTPISVASGAELRFGRNDTFGNHAVAVSQAITVNGGAITNTGNFFTTLGAVTLNAGTINSVGGAVPDFPSFSLRGPIAVGGSAASTISGSGPNSQMVVGANSAGSQTTFDVANATGDGAADLVVSVLLQNNRDNALAPVATGLVKTGAGTMALSAANTFTGPTTVSAGTLLVSGSIGPSATTVSNPGTTLGGTGTVGAVTVDAGAFLLGGDGDSATGALTSGANVTLNDGAAIRLTLGTGLAHSSLVRTGGTWTFDSDQAFSLSPGAAAGAYDNIIVGLTGGEAGLASIGSWLVLNPEYAGSSFSLDASNNVDLALVPEPNVAMSLLGGVGLLLGLRRRRS